ncbi:MAG: hypothetical protein BJ554DRAFT_1667, partial [Olpidium bornovanus]
PGSAGVAGHAETSVDRRERLRKLALEVINLDTDPYFMKNHLGSYECKLCLTLHTNEGSYLAHTQGKKHQTNLARRAALDARDRDLALPARPGTGPGVSAVKRNIIKIGRPGYKVTKVRDPITRQVGLLFQIQYPELNVVDAGRPRHRFMSAYEQKVEPANRSWQYLIFAAEPYENVAFKIQSREIDKSEGRFWMHWDPDSKQFSLQFLYKADRSGALPPPPGAEDSVVYGAPLRAPAPPPVPNPLNPYLGGAQKRPIFVSGNV